MTYKVKVCQHCGKEYEPTNGKQKYCKECRPVVRAAQARASHSKSRKVNPEKKRIDNANYRKANLEKEKARAAKWYETNREKKKTRSANWREENPEKEKTTRVNYRKANREKIKTHDADYRKANHAKRAVSHFKRRGLSSNPIFLNLWSPGKVGHHRDPDYVIFITEKLHTSIPHNVWTGKNMEQINALAMQEAGLTADVLDDTLPFN